MNLVMIVIGMAVVTYIPRLLPFLFAGDKRYHPKVRQFLSYIPLAILGALIFPGVLSSTGDISSAVTGLIIAVWLAWRRAPLILVVVGSIVAAFLTEALVR